MKSGIAGWALCLVLFAAAGALAADTANKGKTNSAPKSDKAPSTAPGVDQAALAKQLAASSRARKDALGLAMAARLVQEVGSKKADWPKKVEKGPKPTSDEDATAKNSASDTPEQLTAEAKQLAVGDQKLLAAIDTITTSAQARGAVAGPTLDQDVLCYRCGVAYTITFEAGQPALIRVLGDGRSDLDLFVYDQGGHLIAKDDDYTDDCRVGWIPAWTGPFRVVVKNNGRANAYTMMTN